MKGSMLSVNRYYFRFRGRSAHAAADPHSGRSALDALELMNIGVNYLREHVTDDVRLHYTILSGGMAPNVVPDYAESYYYVRANEPQNLADVSERVQRIARGAAMMTDTEVEIVYKSGSTRVLSNETLADLQYDVMRRLGAIAFSDDEIAYAEAVNAHFGDANVKTLVERYGVDPDLARQPLIGEPQPSRDKGDVSPGSTDMGDMSWYAPCSMLQTATWATRAAAHSWGVVATGRTSIGHKGMLYAAKVMAMSAAELVEKPEKLREAQAELRAALEATPYVCPIPDDVPPPSHRRIRCDSDSLRGEDVADANFKARQDIPAAEDVITGISCRSGGSVHLDLLKVRMHDPYQFYAGFQQLSNFQSHVPHRIAWRHHFNRQVRRGLSQRKWQPAGRSILGNKRDIEPAHRVLSVRIAFQNETSVRASEISQVVLFNVIANYPAKPHHNLPMSQ